MTQQIAGTVLFCSGSSLTAKTPNGEYIRLEANLASFPVMMGDTVLFKGLLDSVSNLTEDELAVVRHANEEMEKAEEDLLSPPDLWIGKKKEEVVPSDPGTKEEQSHPVRTYHLEEGTMPILRVPPSLRVVGECFKVIRDTSTPMFYRAHFVQSLLKYVDGSLVELFAMIDKMSDEFLERNISHFQRSSNKILRTPLYAREEREFFNAWRREKVKRSILLLGIKSSEIRKSGLKDEEIPSFLLRHPEKILGLDKAYRKRLEKTIGRGVKKGEDEDEEAKVRKNQREVIKFVEKHCDEENALGIDFFAIPKRLIDACVSLFGKSFEAVEVGERQIVVPLRFYRESSELAHMISSIRKEKYWPSPKPRFERKDLDSEQKAAVTRALANNVYVISGVAGAGKTTLIKEIVGNLERWGKKWTLIANNGIASARIKTVVGTNNASTVSSLIYSLHGKENIMRFKALQHIVVDEASTLSTADFLVLLRKMRKFGVKAKLTLLGDINQLDAVGRGLFFEEIVKNELLPMTKLTRVYRTDDEAIYANCTSIANNAGSLVYNETFSVDEGGLPSLYAIVRAMKNAQVPLLDFVVICPWKGTAGPYSLESMNERIKAIYGTGTAESRRDKKGREWHVGDKIRQLINDDDRKCYNGNIGIVKGFKGTKMTVEFELAGELLYEFEHKPAKTVRNRGGDGQYAKATRSLTDLALSYAITIHSCQGGQWPIVIIVIPERKKAQRDFLNSKMMYTAISRAMENVFIIADRETVEKAAFLRPKEKPDPLRIMFEEVSE